MPKLRHSRGLPLEIINHSDLLDMPDVGGTVSDHDSRYYTEAELGSVVVPSGASLIGVSDAGAYFVAADVEAILQEIMAGILPGAYLRLDGTNVPTANYVWTTNLTTTGTGTFGGLNIRNQNELRFYDNGNYVGFEAPALGANQIWVLPNADGGANELLQTDGGGNLGWTTNLTWNTGTNTLTLSDGTETLIFDWNRGVAQITSSDSMIFESGNNMSFVVANTRTLDFADATAGGLYQANNTAISYFRELQIHNSVNLVFAQAGSDMLFGADGNKAYWGTASDCSVTYNGTDMVFFSSEVGSGTIRFDSVNNWTVNGIGAVTISNVAPAGVGTATISKWFTIKDNVGTVYYIPAWT